MSEKILKKIKENKIVIGIFALGIFLLFFQVSSRGLWMDENAVFWYLSMNPWQFVVNYWHIPDNHPPLFYLLVVSLYKLLPLKVLGVRLVSIFSGIGLLVLSYRFSWLLFKDKLSARLAMLSVVLSSYFVLISQMARYHALAALLTLLSLYYFTCLSFQNNNKKKNLLLFVVFAVLTSYTDLPHFVYLILVTNVFYFYKILRKETILKFKSWFISQLILVVSFLLIIWMFYLRIFEQGDKGFGLSSLLGKNIIQYAACFLMHFYAFFFGENILPWNFLIFFSGLFAACITAFYLIRNLFKAIKDQSLNLLVYYFLAFVILNTVFLNFADPRYNFIVYPKYVFAAFPLFVILLSRVIILIDKVWLRNVALVIFVGISLFGLFNFYSRGNYINASYFNDFSNYVFVRDNSQMGDGVVINGDLNGGTYKFFKGDYFYNLIPVDLDPLSSSSAKFSRVWFFSTGSDDGNINNEPDSKIPAGFKIYYLANY